MKENPSPWDTFPFLLDFRLEAGGDVVWFLEDSSVGREEGLVILC